MLAYDEALTWLLKSTAALEPIDAGLTEACGRVLAADLKARLSQPPFAASAMDGYAIRFADHAGPWRVIGESAAGARFRNVIKAGEAVRIFTGAVLPGGADTVVVQEDVQRDGNTLVLTGQGPLRTGAHVRREGGDFKAAETLITAGTVLRPAHIGLAAAAGHAALRVWRRPRVTLIATGNELVPPGIMPAKDQIVSSNSVMLRALFETAGAEVSDMDIIADNRAAITAAIAAARCDLLVTIGGASVGDHDLVQPALKAAGAEVDFWKVAIRPGKPLIAGSLGGTRVLGLPGNPVSAYVCALLFALPLLRRMAGVEPAVPALAKARLLAPLGANGDRRDHLRARLSEDGVMPFQAQDSAMLGVLAASNALIVRPHGAAAAEIGEWVPVLPLDSFTFTP